MLCAFHTNGSPKQGAVALLIFAKRLQTTHVPEITRKINVLVKQIFQQEA